MPQSSVREDIEKALEQIERAEENQRKLDPALSPNAAPRAVRSFVTRLAVWVWALFLAILVIFIIFGGGYATSDKVSTLIEILKIGILPIVTFAIGHYFGSRSD